jgi:hypothetical protein
VQGALSGAQALGGAFGPLLFSAIYKVTSTEQGVAHGFAWFAAAGVCFVAFATSLLLPEREVIDLRSEKPADAQGGSPDSAAGGVKKEYSVNYSDRTVSTTYVDEVQPLLEEDGVEKI